ncbi:hypothetical protein HIM_03066 [Hirsutella minnesotensis 3608]|nr:hypothetical protein HIM_03066 [Hirsutella minnesotensis 3608]
MWGRAKRYTCNRAVELQSRSTDLHAPAIAAVKLQTSSHPRAGAECPRSAAQGNGTNTPLPENLQVLGARMPHLPRYPGAGPVMAASPARPGSPPNDFEVSMFLTETNTRHSLLAKHKYFRGKAPPMIKSNSTRLIGETDHVPVDVEAVADVPLVREADSDEEDVRLADIPVAGPRNRPKRQRHVSVDDDDDYDGGVEGDGEASAIEIDSDAEEPASKRLRGEGGLDGDDAEGDEKKKLAMDVSYEGFAIYGRVLCLVVKRRGDRAQARSGAAGAKTVGQGQARMENWITSTQIPVGEDLP